MIPDSSKPLKIYSASAGSGKTYNLVLMYLRLILSDQLEPVYFSSIIAMTFTNKAAIEMKQRIIEALNTLGNFDEANKKAQVYRTDIAKHLALKEEEVTRRAKLCLKQILHHYEDFNVLTIDKFNLRLIRSFSRDLDINMDFQTSTSEKDVLSEIVDLLLDEINQPDFKELTEITLKYAKENAEDESRWDFKREVKSLAEQLINEKNFDTIQQLLTEDFSIRRYEELKKEIKELQTELLSRAKVLHQLFFSYDPSGFPGASTTTKAFEKLTDEKEVLKGNYLTFFSPTIVKYLQEDAKSKSFPEDLKQKGSEFVHFYSERIKRYIKFNEFKKSYFNIALLQMIARELENYKRTGNIVLISEFNKLISELLKNEEAPYIYERIGNRYRHYLLDEFQDTSRLQWTNLVPLIHDSLGNFNQNLIVGDPKQSIYRFKNGLAEQFVALPAIYNPEKDPQLALKSAYFESMGDQKSLNRNWRSKKEIVEFNNLFFSIFKSQFTGLMDRFYQDLEQEANSENTGGYVYLESFKPEQEKSGEMDESDTADEHEAELAFLLNWINECLADGYDPGDICLLGYTAKQCNTWANFLTDQGFKVVSADSLLLGADSTIQFILLYLKWRINPGGELEAKRFADAYFKLRGQDSFEASKNYWKTIPGKKNSITIFDSHAFLTDQFGSEENFFFHYENLYQLIQQFYQLVQLNELENPFLHQFSDYLFLFDQNKGPELKLFIEHFENEGDKTSVQIPENKDALKILTAHKSKGLEFPIVLIPHVNWNLLIHGSKYLIRDEGLFYYQSISKNSKIDAVASFYEEEFSKALLDKINLIYVAFTRPKDRLYIRNQVLRKQPIHFENTIHQVCLNLPGLVQHDEKFIFEFGTKQQKEAKAGQISPPVFHPVSYTDTLWFPDISIQDKEFLDQENLSEQQRYGNQLHYLLSQINSGKEINDVIRESLMDGQIEQVFVSQLEEELNAIFSLESYQEILLGAEEILREQNIILSASEKRRPDLIVKKPEQTIVLDYKTGMMNPKYLKQVKSYCETLREMKLPGVRGFVFYTGTRMLEEIS